MFYYSKGIPLKKYIYIIHLKAFGVGTLCNSKKPFHFLGSYMYDNVLMKILA